MKTLTFTGKAKLSLILAAAGLLAFVAPQARADEDKDPPTRVARISYVDGSVSIQPGGQGDWGSATKNRPVTIGDKIWVDKDARAELEAGQATLHVGSMTALSFLNLDENITQMRLPEGAINFRVRELREGDIYEVDTPNLAFTVKQAGAFRIDVSEDGSSSRVTVIRGEGEILADGKTYSVNPGEEAEFSGVENPTYSIVKAPAPDGLDRWAEERDLREDKSVSGNYVSRDMPGYSDLDDNGSWRDEPEYGHVWYPRDVPPDWAPYSDGYWSWVGPWGWTWVGYEPWGFAPYHYGRWAFVGGAWGWCPGPYFGPPIYGPAFVGWLGGGWGFGFGIGVGWFPLGWGEPFHPWYHCGPRYVNVINVHNTFIRNVNVINNNHFNYANAHNTRAVTTASHNAFVNGEHINRGATRLTQASLNNAKVTNSVGLKPTQHSSLGASNVNARAARPSEGVQNRSVIARTAPAHGISHQPVQTFNGRATAGNRAGNSSIGGSARANGRFENSPSNSGLNSRQRELSQNRPPSAMPNSNRSTGTATNGAAGSNRPGNNSHVWEAQGNATDRGSAPRGFGSDRPANNGSGSQTARNAQGDRPPWARGGAPSAGGSGSNARPSTPNYNSSRPNANGGGRSYEPPQRNYNPPSGGNRGYSPQPSPRTYSAPSRNYPAPSRSYSPPPSRSYSPPSRSYSAPSHSSGGGGSSHGGGSGSGSHSGGGGGGGSHSGGGGGGGSHGGGGRPHR